MHVQTIISLTGTILCLCMASFQRLHRIPCATCVIRKIELTLRNTIGVLDFYFNEKSENALYSLCNNQRLSALTARIFHKRDRNSFIFIFINNNRIRFE